MHVKASFIYVSCVKKIAKDGSDDCSGSFRANIPGVVRPTVDATGAGAASASVRVIVYRVFCQTPLGAVLQASERPQKILMVAMGWQISCDHHGIAWETSPLSCFLISSLWWDNRCYGQGLVYLSDYLDLMRLCEQGRTRLSGEP